LPSVQNKTLSKEMLKNTRQRSSLPSVKKNLAKSLFTECFFTESFLFFLLRVFYLALGKELL
jgi:hypothetical protein